jgi:hypothetical protein
MHKNGAHRTTTNMVMRECGRMNEISFLIFSMFNLTNCFSDSILSARHVIKVWAKIKIFFGNSLYEYFSDFKMFLTKVVETCSTP